MWTTTLVSRLAAAALVGVFGLGIGGASVAAAAAPSASSGRAASLRITVQPSATASDASFSDSITVMNVGQDSASDVMITVPFDTAAVQLLGVQFNQPDAWVTSLSPGSFQAHLGNLGGQSQQVQAIVSFAKLAGYSTTSALPSAIAFHYSSKNQAHSGTINTQLSATEAPAVVQPSSASMMVSVGGTLPLNSAIFAADEAVAFWYNTADGQAVPLYIRNGQITTEHQYKEQLANGTTRERDNGAYLNADAQGMIATTLRSNGLTPGIYTLVAHGLNSSATQVIAFQVQ